MTSRMAIVLVIVILSGFSWAWGQTTLTLDQLRPAPAGIPLADVKIVASYGTLRLPVALGEGLELKLIDGVVTIISPKPVIILPPFITDISAARQADGSYQPAEAPPSGLAGMLVYRNGQRLRRGADYNVAAGFKILPIVPWPVDASITVDFVP